MNADLPMTSSIAQLNQQGFVLLTSVVSDVDIDQLLSICGERFDLTSNTAVGHSRKGNVVAARNVIDVAPEIHRVWGQGILANFLIEVLGVELGLVRVLFFDKPPERTWALPWHKDQTIAVCDNSLPSSFFSRPTVKAGVPHVIAADQILKQMITLRIHLDEVTEENGPLRVIPGSHHSSVDSGIATTDYQPIYAQAGDVLAMRPLITHSSGASNPTTQRHRRILHLEFAPQSQLPDGYQWHRYVRLIEFAS